MRYRVVTLASRNCVMETNDIETAVFRAIKETSHQFPCTVEEYRDGMWVADEYFEGHLEQLFASMLMSDRNNRVIN